MNKNVKRLGIVAVAIIIVVLLVKGCPGPKDVHGNKYEVETTKVDKAQKPVVKQVYLLLDASGSMKGYMDFKGLADAKKNFANNICFPLDNLINDYDATLNVKYGGKGKFENVDTKRLNALMADGKETFNDATTMLADMISDAVKQVSDTSVSMLVSDMLLSYGQKELVNKKDIYYNKNNLSNLGLGVYSAMKEAKDVEVLLLQYTSSFNGHYYYNCQENLDNNFKKQASKFDGQLMEKRPYYIMVLGKKEVLAGLLDNNVFVKPDNLYASFGLDASNMTQDKFSIVLSPSSTWVCNNSSEDPESTQMGTIWTTAALETAQETFTVVFKKFDIPAFLNQKYEIGDYHLSSTLSNVRDVTSPSNPNELRFEVTLQPFDKLPETGEAEFTLTSKNVWVDEASVDDDANVTDKELEGKTWGLSAIIKNIELVHYGEQGRNVDVVARVKFNVSKK